MVHGSATSDSNTLPTVLILGLGDTGVLTAGHLSKHCRVIGVTTKAMKKKVKIIKFMH